MERAIEEIMAAQENLANENIDLTLWENLTGSILLLRSGQHEEGLIHVNNTCHNLQSEGIDSTLWEGLTRAIDLVLRFHPETPFHIEYWGDE